MASPSAVSTTLRVSRTNSGRPTDSSRRRTCWLTVGCRRPRARAAPVKLRDWETARNVRRSSGSYTAPPGDSSRLAMTLIALIAACDESEYARMDAHELLDDRNYSGRPLSTAPSSTVHPPTLLLSQGRSRALVHVP